ncbi:RES family NAD+ phosphorylase [Salinimicrobium sp. CDJ15-81-2]|nr:RES family NAD+ phosphorylase [Salinimicrobium nanhaiense]
MRVFRVERKKYLDTTLQGIGAAQTEAYRWNSLNTLMVYTAESRALATLEVSVHLDLNEDLPKDRYYVGIDIPDDVLIYELKTEDLPENWDAKPPILETQFIGDDFIKSKIAAVLKVPSAIVPPEANYLINPNHADAQKITVISQHPFNFDQRLKQK